MLFKLGTEFINPHLVTRVFENYHGNVVVSYSATEQTTIGDEDGKDSKLSADEVAILINKAIAEDRLG